MDLDNDIPGIVWGSMQHTVIGKTSIVYDVIQFSILPTSATPGLSSALSSGHEAARNILDCHVQDLLREIISSDIPSDSDSVSSSKLDFVNDELRLLFVEAVKSRDPGVWSMQCMKLHHTYSVTTTFAPSLAKRRAQLRPMP